MKEPPTLPIAELLVSPIPILNSKRNVIKIVVNDCCLLVYTVKLWLDNGKSGLVLWDFPWLLLSLLFTVILFFVNSPKYDFSMFSCVLPGCFLSVIVTTRIAVMAFNLSINDSVESFMKINNIAIDILQTIFWCTFGFNPSPTLRFIGVEAILVTIRVMILRSMHASMYTPLKLNLTCALVLGVHGLLYTYLIAASYYFHMLTAAVVKLRHYVSRFTLQKNPSLHLVCLLVPPLLTGVTEAASRHKESPSFKKGDGNAGHIITAANQVLLLPRSVELHLRVEWKVLQFHWKDLINVEKLLSDIIERLPTAESPQQTHHPSGDAPFKKNGMVTSDCEVLVFCHAKYLTFVLEAALTRSLWVTRRKRLEAKGAHRDTKFLGARVTAELEQMKEPGRNASNIQSKSVHDELMMTTHLLHFHITFGKEVGEDMYSAAASPSGRVVKIFPILFKREKEDMNERDRVSGCSRRAERGCRGVPQDDQIEEKEEEEEEEEGEVEYLTSLSLSAAKKILRAFGGDLAMREYRNEGRSLHCLVLSIPCRLPAVANAPDPVAQRRLWEECNNDVTSMRRIMNAARKMVDFGMETQLDALFLSTERALEVFTLRVDRISTANFSTLHLYRVIFITSPGRAPELRALGFKGQLVLITSSSNPSSNLIPQGVDFLVEWPFTLSAVDQFLRSVSERQRLCRTPRFLTLLDRMVMVLRPRRYIPVVSWSISVLETFSQLQFTLPTAALGHSFCPPTSHPDLVPTTTAYTPAKSGVDIYTMALSEELDYEHLTNNKIVASSDSLESINIADNFLFEEVYSELSFSSKHDFYQWRAQSVFWTTNHDFKPRVLRSHAKLEACAAAFLNVYPFVAVLFIKLCVFLTFTASDPRFNFVWNIVFAMQYVAVIALFTVRVTSNNVKWARVIAVPYLHALDLLRLFFRLDPNWTLIYNVPERSSSVHGTLQREIFGTYSGEELIFCFCLGPLMMLVLWTNHCQHYKRMTKLCMLLQVVLSYTIVFLHLGPVLGGHFNTIGFIIPFMWATAFSELKKGEGSSNSLYVYHVKAMYTQEFLRELVQVLLSDLRNPLIELLKTQDDYVQLCRDETLSGEASLTGELMDEMAQFRRTFLFLTEVQKHFALQEVLGIDVDRECYSLIAGVPVGSAGCSAKVRKLSDRRLKTFHLIGELTELCRCFESEEPLPVKVFLKVCPLVPVTVNADKGLLVSFLVNAMSQSLSNIKTFPQVWAGTADRVHEIVVLVSRSQSNNEWSLNLTVLDTGLRNVLTDCGLLVGEGDSQSVSQGTVRNFNQQVSEDEDVPDVFPYACYIEDNDENQRRGGEICATVCVQLQEYLFRKAVVSVGGSFRRAAVSTGLSSYHNSAQMTLPTHSTESSTTLRLPISCATSAARMLAVEYSQFRDMSSLYRAIFSKMTWRWQCFVKPLCLDSSKHQQPCDDPANNLSGFATSTSGSPPPLSRADGVGRYTTQDIHPRTILIVEVELTHDRRSRLVSSFRRQGWQCSAATSFERLQAIPFAQLSTFDVILVTNEFNKRCLAKGNKEMVNLHKSLFYGYSPLHIPFVVCLADSDRGGKKEEVKEDRVQMEPCNLIMKRPFKDFYIDTIVLQSDKYALQKLFY